MTSRAEAGEPRFIWATRGRTWGFRFLRRGGLPDPLGVYEASFATIGDRPEAWHRAGTNVALRFPDPEGRQDAAGRVIPHDFVLLGDWTDGINSLEEGRQRIWTEVADEFESTWDSTDPPPPKA